MDRGDCSLFVVRDGSDVVVEGGKCPVTEVIHCVCDIGLGQHVCLLQVTVRDAVPSWIVSGDDASLDVIREGCAPQQGLFSISKKDATHTRLSGIHRTNSGRVVGHEFSKTCGVSSNALGKQFKVCEVVAEVFGDMYLVLFGMGDTKLKGAKETGAPGDGSPHEMKLANDVLPGLETDMLLFSEFIKNGKDTGFAAVSRFEGALSGIKDPTKDFFAFCPASIALQCFLFRYSFFAVGCGSSGRGKDTINSMENAAVDMLAERWGTLSKTNEVVNEHIDMGNQARVEEEWRLEIGGQMASWEHERSEHGTGTPPGGDQRIS